jgi:hypothetical protein
MDFLRDTTWQEVFQNWKKREGSNPGWVKCATEVKGWPDWASWRKFSTQLVRADQRDWELYRFTNPMEEIPEMLVGPYSAWQKNLPAKNILSFRQFLDYPEKLKQFGNHEGVDSILRGLPFETSLIGLVRGDTKQVVCLEGNHRAVAIALAKRQGKKIDFSATEVTIALAFIPEEEVYLLDDMLERGSEKC